MFQKLLLTALFAGNLCSAQIYDFNTDGDFEGWTGALNCTTSVANGYLTITPTDENTIAKVSNNTLSIDADSNKYIHFFYKNLSVATNATNNAVGNGNDQLRFEAGNGVEYGGNNNPINLNSSDFEVKTVNMSNTTNFNWWSGTLTAIHLYPRRNNSGSDTDDIQITRIEISNSSVPTPLPGPAFVENFETWAGTIGNNNGNTENTQGEYVIVANPETGGINTSSNVLKSEQTTGSPKWDWVALQNIGTILLDDNNGKAIRFKIMSETETTFTLAVIPFLGGGSFKGPDNILGNEDDNLNEREITVTAGEWQEVEFDFTNYVAINGGAFSRLDIVFNRDENRDGDIYYIDELQQVSPSSLSSSSPTFSNLTIYPNPTTGIINLSDISKIGETIIISNVLGQVVKTVKTNNVIDISNLPQGIYFLQTKNLLIKKIIKK